MNIHIHAYVLTNLLECEFCQAFHRSGDFLFLEQLMRYKEYLFYVHNFIIAISYLNTNQAPKTNRVDKMAVAAISPILSELVCQLSPEESPEAITVSVKREMRDK